MSFWFCAQELHRFRWMAHEMPFIYFEKWFHSCNRGKTEPNRNQTWKRQSKAKPSQCKAYFDCDRHAGNFCSLHLRWCAMSTATQHVTANCPVFTRNIMHFLERIHYKQEKQVTEGSHKHSSALSFCVNVDGVRKLESRWQCRCVDGS